MKDRVSLDTYVELPKDMKKYLAHYGYHFSKPMYEFAVKNMYKAPKGTSGKEKMQPVEKSKVEEMLKKYNVTLENDILYDACYLYSMAMSDFFGKSLPNEQYVAMWIRDVMDDVDKRDGYIFNRFYADCCYMGIPIDWTMMADLDD